jgi:hypothetical protein
MTCIACGLIFLFQLTFDEGTARARVDAAKRKEIRKLLRLTGSQQMARQMMQQMILNLRTAFPKVPNSYWNGYLKRANTSELVEMIVPIYDRHLSRKDIQGLITFYSSPVGRKFISVQPQLVAESMQVGQRWGRKLADKMVREIKKKKLNK